MKLKKRSDDVSIVERGLSAFDRLFDEMRRVPFFRTPATLDRIDFFGWRPLADIEETDNEFIVQMDLPGLKKKDVHLSVQDHTLVVRGEKEREGSKKDEGYQVRERFYGKFERTFQLPESVDMNAVDAKFKDGVLTVKIKKRTDMKAKEIAIR